MKYKIEFRNCNKTIITKGVKSYLNQKVYTDITNI